VPPESVKPRALEIGKLGLVLALAGALSSSCLSLEDTQTPATGGTGTGGTVGDASWQGGSTSTGGSATGGASGAAGSGGFVSGSCDACTSSNGCECVPEVGQGWTHVRVADGTLSKCPDVTDAPVLVGSGATDTGCGTCTCGGASPGVCGFGMVRYSYAGCAGTGYYSLDTSVGTCHTLSGTTVAYMPKPFGEGGGCDPGTAQPKPPAFATKTSLCSQASEGACGTSGTCVPKPTTAFDASACVMFDSQGVDVACPPGYPNKQSFSTGFDDTRTCKCNCKPSVSCSGGSVTFDCAGTTNQANQCKDATTVTEYKILSLPSVTDTNCYPDGASTPSGGTVMPSGLRVVCCR
jgi:hypothetical protein